ncbi:hypothetical protein H6P81_020979 [Aristolochia fimbriata]|uniref:Proteasome assembly chaperone 2 n=1 Tax=Aristolochia fimbriata TaxID=158543 RepID=A0AAV7DXT1_ARIFI|nr:hypothetical protein H6P81_020979 [Aristolochia fimbriata]
MEFTLEDGKTPDPECSTLLLPALSIGNVGQLAIDLLIASLKADKIGYLDDPSVLPCVGNDAYGPVPQGNLALPVEAYDSPSYSSTLVQQRSPIIKGMTLEFAKNVANFAVEARKKHVIVLSSLDSGKKHKIEFSNYMQIYYLSSISPDGTDAECEKLGWRKLDEYDQSKRGWKYMNSLAEGNPPEDDFCPEDELTDDDYCPSLPFAALFSCCKAKGLKVTCILCYCSEGDNISDSYQLAGAACRLLGHSAENFHGDKGEGWVVPLSWMSVYGPPPDTSLF